MKVKMCTIGKIFGKICLNAIGDTFLQYVVCKRGRDGVRHKGKGQHSIFWWRGSESSPVPPLVGNPDPRYEECAWSDYCNNFEKSIREKVFSFKATNLQHARLEMKKRWQNL